MDMGLSIKAAIARAICQPASGGEYLMSIEIDPLIGTTCLLGP